MDTKALSPEHPELKAPLQEAPTPAPLAAPRRRRWGRTLCIALGVTLGLAAVAVVSGVLTKVALDRQRDGEAAAVAAPAASPQSPGAGASSPAAGGRGAEAGDDREAFLPEGQSVTEETIYLPLQTDALMVEALDGPASRFAFTSPGPCRTLRQLSNISLDLSAAATGCRGAQCSITLKVLLPEATDECRAAAPAPFQTVYLLPGFSCQPHYYRTLTERLASWGWAVLTVSGVGPGSAHTRRCMHARWSPLACNSRPTLT